MGDSLHTKSPTKPVRAHSSYKQRRLQRRTTKETNSDRYDRDFEHKTTNQVTGCIRMNCTNATMRHEQKTQTQRRNLTRTKAAL